MSLFRKRLKDDRRSEPRVGERVPYVIVHGSPGLPLIQLVRQPRELLKDNSLRINVTYYITKQVGQIHGSDENLFVNQRRFRRSIFDFL